MNVQYEHRPGLELHTGPGAHLLPSPAEMAEMDRVTIASGTSSAELMERAGSFVFDELLAMLSDTGSKVALLLCGPGNNGGDGLVVGRKMLQEGLEPIVIVAKSKRYSEDFRGRLEEFRAVGGRVSSFPESEPTLDLEGIGAGDLSASLTNTGVIVDALLGTGQTSAPRGNVAGLLQALGEQLRLREVPVLAVDIPTGVNGDTGEVYESALPADLTACIECIKRGMLQYPARDYCGRIAVGSIGIDVSPGASFSILSSMTCPRLEERAQSAHKGSFGHVLVAGGSASMPGAPVLSAYAALRAGAGLVTVAMPGSAMPPIHEYELMRRACQDEGRGRFGISALADLDQLCDRASVFAVGPGLGREAETGEFLRVLLSRAASRDRAVVLDADGLNLLADGKGEAWELPERLVLTPHPGEAAHLLGSKVPEIQRDRSSAAKHIAEKFRAVCVLKGAGTIVYSNGSGVVNTSGTPFLATAGSGDVLTGIIAACIAQGRSVRAASELAVYCHGVAGQRAAKRLGGPIIARDVIAELPGVLGGHMGALGS